MQTFQLSTDTAAEGSKDLASSLELADPDQLEITERTRVKFSKDLGIIGYLRFAFRFSAWSPCKHA